MGQGYIKLYRQIQDNWLWQEKRIFSKTEAWLDILLTVNHKEKKVLVGNELVQVDPGSRITSIRQLCDRWGWSNTKVISFLDLLTLEKMIMYKSDTKKTVITVENWSSFQCEESQSNRKNIVSQSQKRTNNNDKKDKNEKIYIVGLTDNGPKKEKDIIPYKEIIDYLNSKAGTGYKHTNKKTEECILARWREGYRFEDFKTVIDIKVAEWMGIHMEQYIRPETLFGTKFEGYLNQKNRSTKTSGKFLELYDG